MNEIKRAAIRLIANAYLYGRDKKKDIHGYCFDSSFLTKRGITSVADLEKLQNELNHLGWCFNIINFNSYSIQEKSFLAKMTKLGFGRLEGKTDEELAQELLVKFNERITETFYKFLVEKAKNEKDLRIKDCVFEKEVSKIDNGMVESTIQCKHGKSSESVLVKTFEEETSIGIRGVEPPIITIKNCDVRSAENKFEEMYEVIKDALITREATMLVAEEVEKVIGALVKNKDYEFFNIYIEKSKAHRMMYGLRISGRIFSSHLSAHGEFNKLLFKMYQEKFEMWIEWSDEECPVPVTLGSYLTEQDMRNKIEKVVKNILGIC